MPRACPALGGQRGWRIATAGHTEAAVDLARMAGLTPAGVLCEILDETGERATRTRLLEHAEEFNRDHHHWGVNSLSTPGNNW